MDEIVDHYPDVCGECGQPFGEQQRQPGGRFGRRQVAELPPISVVFTDQCGRGIRYGEPPVGGGEKAQEIVDS